MSFLEKLKQNPYILSIVVLLPSIMALVASSATNVCQPNIAGYFGATQYEANTVITSYIIANGIMLPTTGFLTKTIGKKMFFIYCIAIFCIGAFLCIIAPNLQALILARVIQGLGGGCILPLCQAYMLEIYPEHQKGFAMALYGVAAMFSPLFGPFVGGYLTDNYSWQWVFIVNIPLCIIALILVKIFMADDVIVKEKYNKKFDLIGFLGIAVAMGCMQIVLDKGQQYNWFDCTWICWLAGISLFSFIFFIVWELEYHSPIVNLRIFKDKNFFIGTILGSSVNMIIYVTIVLLPSFLQSLMGYTAMLSGMSLAPRVFSCIIMLLIIGPMVEFLDNRILIASGFFFLGLSTIMYANLNLAISFDYVVIPNILMGIGVILVFIPVSGLVLGTLPKSELSNGAGLHSLCKCVMTAFVVSMSSTLVARLSQVHQTYLVHNLSNFNLAFQSRLHSMAGNFMHFASNYATHKAGGLLYKQMLVQAKLMSYVDVFEMFALIVFLLIPFGFLLKVPKKGN